MPYSFDWVDAFAETPFGGNACAVVHDAGDLAVETRLALVRETSLSECAYLVPSDRADFGARYYLAHREIPMAGHPTVAAVTSLVDRGLVDVSAGPVRFTLEVGAGVLPIETWRDASGRIQVSMTQARPEIGPPLDPAPIAAIYGLAPEDVAHPPRIVSTGTPFCITLLRSKEALRRARLDVERLEAWREATARPDAGLMEPFLATMGGETPAGDVFSRLLLAPPSPAEDPFTGSATGCLGAYLWSRSLIPAPRFAAEQGHWLGRPGRATVEALGAPDAIEGVKVSGPGVVLMRGELHV